MHHCTMMPGAVASNLMVIEHNCWGPAWLRSLASC